MKILITSIIDLKRSQHNRPHQFVKYLSKNHDITVLSINDWWKGRQDDLESYSKEFDEMYSRITYIHFTSKKISPILQEIISPFKVKKIVKEGFDVHLNYNTLISGYIASCYIRTVYDMADDLIAMIKESPQIPKFMRPLGGMLGNIMLKSSINKSERITLTTQNLISSYDIPLCKCEIISNGVDTSLFEYQIHAKEELGFNGFIIGYVGVLREWVDFEPVFLALKELRPEIKMLIVGKEGLFEETIQLSIKCGVSDRVTFTGMIPYSQVPKYISAMDICLIPFNKGSISENALPLKLFEYMACEKPVITTELPGIKKIANQYVSYASSSEEYVIKITELYENDDLRLVMGKEGRKFVESNYDWEKIVQHLENVLADTARKGRNDLK